MHEQRSNEYFKSLQPTQLLAERGPEIVVFNPGSWNVRVGLGSWKMPVITPHCIAHYMPGMNNVNNKGAVGEQAASEQRTLRREKERDEILLQVESILGVKSPNVVGVEDEAGTSEEAGTGGFARLEPERTSREVQWTRVALEDGTYRRCICGNEALRIPASEPYRLRRPMCRGRLNVSRQYPMQQVCDDIYAIWNWILLEKLSIDTNSRRHLSAVLVVPDTFDNRETKEMISVLLKDLTFQSVVVHQECAAATFGNGISAACVVQIGAQVTSITCVEDGVSISMTHRELPYGGEDISRCLLWIQQRHRNWPPLDTNPSTNSLDSITLDRLKEDHCVATVGEHVAAAEVISYCAGKPAECYKINLVAVNVPPAGLFYPSLFALEERKLLAKPWYYFVDHEDTLVENGEAGSYEQPVAVSRGVSMEEARPPGLHEAIIDSICSMGRPDLKGKFFSSILLVGGTASTRGLLTFLEGQILSALPRQEAVDKVEVFAHRVDPSVACWKGGVVLGVLDFSRDAWIQRDEWLGGGPRVGSTKKYKDSTSLHAQTFWYDAVLE